MRTKRVRRKKRQPKYHIGTRQQARVRALTDGVDPAKVVVVPIDAAKFFHEALVCNRSGEILEPPFQFDVYRSGFDLLTNKVRLAAERVGAERILVGVESTGHYHENLVRHLQRELAAHIILINPFSTNEMRNLNLNSIKTDEVDLDPIAELLIHHKGAPANLPEEIYLELRDLTRWRSSRVDDRARLIQQIHGHLDRIWPGIFNPHEKWKALFANFEALELQCLLRHCPSPHQVLELGVDGLLRTFREHGCRLGPKRAARIINHAQGALKPRPEDIEHRLELLALDVALLDKLNSSIAPVEKRIRELLMQTPGKWLLTIRGVAEATAAEVIAEIGPPEAYDSAAAVVKLAGMNPSTYQTGMFESERNPITKFGRATLRDTAVNAARRLVHQNPYLSVPYRRMLDQGKPKKVALVAMAAKFLRVCFAVMRDEVPFNPPTWTDPERVKLCQRPEGMELLQETDVTDPAPPEEAKAVPDNEENAPQGIGTENTCLPGDVPSSSIDPSRPPWQPPQGPPGNRRQACVAGGRIVMDFSSLKHSVPIGDVLSAYGVSSLRKLGQESLIGPCPLHGGDNPTAFRVHLTRGLWNCFTRCGGGDVLDLVARLEGEGTSIYQAAAKLQQMAGQCTSQLASDAAGGRPRQLVELPFRLTIAPHPYLTKVRGLTPATCSHFGVGMCQRGILTGRAAIPIHDEHGHLVAYAGRTIEPLPDKYRFPSGFPKGQILFNAWRQKDAADLVVVEGFFDVFHLHQNGYPHTVALMGSTVSLAQFAWLVSSRKRLVLLLDGDEAGQRGQRLLAQQLDRAGQVYRSIHLEKGVQPDHLSRQELFSLLA